MMQRSDHSPSCARPIQGRTDVSSSRRASSNAVHLFSSAESIPTFFSTAPGEELGHRRGGRSGRCRSGTSSYPGWSPGPLQLVTGTAEFPSRIQGHEPQLITHRPRVEWTSHPGSD
ncbi:hypothetical protein AMC87_PD00788 (plasmid) [Rhizobium phaseoli]|nr:hypothetical protein AMC87_PD00788 [Rhizobium phaseoli]